MSKLSAIPTSGQVVLGVVAVYLIHGRERPWQKCLWTYLLTETQEMEDQPQASEMHLDFKCSKVQGTFIF